MDTAVVGNLARHCSHAAAAGGHHHHYRRRRQKVQNYSTCIPL